MVIYLSNTATVAVILGLLVGLLFGLAVECHSPQCPVRWHKLHQGFLTLMELASEAANSDTKGSNVGMGVYKACGPIFASLRRSSKLSIISISIFYR